MYIWDWLVASHWASNGEASAYNKYSVLTDIFMIKLKHVFDTFNLISIE